MVRILCLTLLLGAPITFYTTDRDSGIAMLDDGMASVVVDGNEIMRLFPCEKRGAIERMQSGIRVCAALGKAARALWWVTLEAHSCGTVIGSQGYFEWPPGGFTTTIPLLGR